MIKALFSHAFRPFFPLVCLSAIFYPMMIVAHVINDYAYGGGGLDIISWHAHEMLFGFAPALLAGFLLTASFQWTKRGPVDGFLLGSLVLLWILGRVALLLPGDNLQLSFSLTMLFLPFLISLVFIQLKGHTHFYPVLSLLLLLFISQFIFWYGQLFEDPDLVTKSKLLAPSTLLLFMFHFSGKLVPFFTNSYLKRDVIKLPSLFNRIVLLILILEMIGQLSEMVSIKVHIFVCALCFFLLIFRQFFLFTKDIVREPMILSIHVAHGWLAMHFAVKVFEMAYPELALGKASLHALLAGGLGMFSISIMARASLGHTGNKIKSSFGLNYCFVSITVGAIFRVGFPLITQDLYNTLLHISMGFFTLAYIVFLFKFFPLYLSTTE